MRPLPKGRDARARLILRNSSDYIKRMNSTDIDRLLLSLSKTDGLMNINRSGFQ